MRLAPLAGLSDFAQFVTQRNDLRPHKRPPFKRFRLWALHQPTHSRKAVSGAKGRRFNDQTKPTASTA